MTNSWAKGAGEYDFTTAAGNTCRIRPASLTDLVFDGVIDNVDTLSAIVSSKIAQKKSGGRKTKAEQGIEMLKGAEEVRDALRIMDKVVVHVLVEPRVYLEPENGQFDDEKIYISSISTEERVEIFREAIKEVKSAAPFRE